MIIAGVLSLWFSAYIVPEPQRIIAEQVGAALLVVGVWTAVQEYLIRRDVEQQNQQLLQTIVTQSQSLLHTVEAHHQVEIQENEQLLENVETLHSFEREVRDIGLTKVLDKSTAFNYFNFIENSQELTFVLRDGRTWLSAHLDAFRSRFRDSGKKTRFIVVHPLSEYMDDLARGVNVSKQYQKDKVLDACNLLIGEYERLPESSRGELEILGHYLTSVLAVYMSEKTLLIEPYFFSVGHNKPPLFAVEPRTEESYYARVKSDLVDLVENHSELLYRNGKKSGVLTSVEIS
jgi:hypothetical protein